MKRSASILLISMLISRIVLSQDLITTEDYDRAVGFMYENYNNKKVFNLFIQPNWFADSTGIWYVNQSIENKKFLKIELPNLNRTDLFDHQRLAVILSDSLGEEIKANDLPISTVEYKSPTELLITAKGKKYILNTETYTLNKLTEEEKSNEHEEYSPDKKWIAFAKD